MRKAVIDTNIIVSALLSSNDEAATVKVLELLLNGQILPVVTDSILQEYGEVLRRKNSVSPKKMYPSFLMKSEGNRFLLLLAKQILNCQMKMIGHFSKQCFLMMISY